MSQLILNKTANSGLSFFPTGECINQECFGSRVGSGLHELLSPPAQNSELISHAPTPGCPGGGQGKAVPVHCCSMAQT